MIYAILAILFFLVQNLCCKSYGERYPKTMYAQNLMIAFSMALVTLIMAALGGAKPLSGDGWLITLGFGVFFIITLGCMTIAISIGHMGLSLLIQNSSLLVPTIFGILVWGEKLTLVKGLGIAFILALLALSAGDGESARGNVKNWNRKRWLLVTLLAFLGDGVLSILQGLMSRADASISSVTFTFWTSLFSAVLAAIAVVAARLGGKAERMLPKKSDRRGFLTLCAGIGVGTAGGNCFTILALTRLPGIVLFPLRQGALVLLMWMAGVLIFRERMTRRGLMMLCVGMLGLVLINL